MNEGAVVASIALLFTVLSSLVGLAYKAGTLSNRVENLEKWRIEFREEIKILRDDMRKDLEEIKAMIKGV